MSQSSFLRARTPVDKSVGILVLGSPPETESPPDYTFIDYRVVSETNWAGDGSVWQFNRDTVAPDITVIELVNIMSISFEICDGMMQRIKADPALIRHFRRVPSKRFDKEPDNALDR